MATTLSKPRSALRGLYNAPFPSLSDEAVEPHPQQHLANEGTTNNKWVLRPPHFAALAADNKLTAGIPTSPNQAASLRPPSTNDPRRPAEGAEKMVIGKPPPFACNHCFEATEEGSARRGRVGNERGDWPQKGQPRRNSSGRERWRLVEWGVESQGRRVPARTVFEGGGFTLF